MSETQEMRTEPLPRLARDTVDSAVHLARLEGERVTHIALARAKVAALGAGLFAGAALLGAGAFAAVTTMLIALLATVVPLWAAGLIVAVIYVLVATVLALVGRNELQRAFAPPPSAQHGTPPRSMTDVDDDIERTRERLGELAHAWSYRADVPARLRDRAAQGADTIKETFTVAADVVRDAVDATTEEIGRAVTSTTRAASDALTRAREG